MNAHAVRPDAPSRPSGPPPRTRAGQWRLVIDPGPPRRGTGPGAALAQSAGREGGAGSGCPVRFVGHLGQGLSRGLVLVKW